MWLENLKELKKKTGMSVKQIADKANLPERTVNRIFSGDTDHPRIDTLVRLGEAMGVKMNEVFADTNVVVATESLVEIKENADVISAQSDLIAVENEMLKNMNAALAQENELLKKELAHKDELIAVHNFYRTYLEQIKKREEI